MQSTNDMNQVLALHAHLKTAPVPVTVKVRAFKAARHEFRGRAQHEPYEEVVDALLRDLESLTPPIVTGVITPKPVVDPEPEKPAPKAKPRAAGK